MPINQLRTVFGALTAALTLTLATHAGAMTRDEYKAAEERIEAEHKAERARCDGLAGNAKDICQAEAKGKEKVAKAELEAQYKPSPRANAKVAEARADAAYDVAKQKCDDLSGNAKDVCMKDAKAAHTSARSEAKPG